jgi:hypothetical protein
MSRKSLFLVSYALAVLSFSAGWIPGAFLLVSAELTIPWFVILVITVYKYGQRGCWVFLGAPLMFFWPIAILWGIYSCFTGDPGCDF